MAPADERGQETIDRMRSAVEAADLDAFVATLAGDVVLHSPISDRAEFRGRDELRDLMRAVFATIEDIEYFEEVGEGRARALFYRARIGSVRLEEASLLRLDRDGKIAEFTLWFRPLGGLAQLTATLGPRLAAGRSRPRAFLLAVLTRPLASLIVRADRYLVKLARR